MPTPERYIPSFEPKLKAVLLEDFARDYGLVHKKEFNSAVEKFINFSIEYFNNSRD